MEMLRFLAGRGRLEVLQHLRAHPRPPPSINELSRAIRIPLGTVWHAVQDLHNLGLVLLDRGGTALLVTLNRSSPAWPDVQRLLDLDVPSPHRLAFDHFANRLRARTPGVSIYLFGSVASGEHRPHSDVDVEVTYAGSIHSRQAVEKACVDAANETLDRFRISVVPIVNARRRVMSAG